MRASKRVYQVMDEEGQTHTNPKGVVNEFLSFYQRLLGGDRKRRFLDLRHLRSWARHVLTDEESMALIKPVSRDDIKTAFVTGRLLKQVNATLLDLIPDVRARSLVADFHPISCCNVIYKVITKILVQRLSKRYALKVDLRKAYDTLEWDFFLAVLQLFGFPSVFSHWIEECVTTPAFSVCINRTSHRFLQVVSDASLTPAPSPLRSHSTDDHFGRTRTISTPSSGAAVTHPEVIMPEQVDLAPTMSEPSNLEVTNTTTPAPIRDMPPQWLARFEYIQKGLQDVQYQMMGAPTEEQAGIPSLKVIADELPVNLSNSGYSGVMVLLTHKNTYRVSKMRRCCPDTLTA
ncbi:UNVERIFIED_CONTAM: hypothetical protein Scaly_0596800 [Sesamum calycinum]|uniref:Reverse transcriptase n=1 Tax=Sesamum calycinum TaxID=2727403 RepID=A0AAW2RSG2_9LAMI